MPLLHQITTASLILSIGVTVVSLLLLAVVCNDRRLRDADLTPEDADHFAAQDNRRVVGTVVMLLLAAAIYFGSRMPFRIGEGANPLFVQLWLGVFLLIFFLLVLGLLDWQATRLYARRHREAIARERIELFREEFKRQAFRANGHGGTPRPTDDLL